MKSQGWTPGEYLGAKDAAHAEFHTAANASHIRVVIKDNTLGLGAKIGSGVGHGECTGLDVFQNLLGRLNGKEEAEIEKEQKGREDLKRAIYAERKWGRIRFVKGGVLVGDKIQDLIDGEKERVKALEVKGKAVEKDSSSEDSDSSSDEEEEKSPEPAPEKKKSSKRKREEQEDEEKTSSKKSKKEKKSKKRKSENEEEKDKAESKKSKKSKKDRKSKSKSTSESETEPLDEAAMKARKKEKKEKKRREKEAAAASVDTEETTSTSKSSKKKSKKDKHKSSSTSESSTKESTPIVSENSGRSTPMGIRSIRARHIAQKRMASMDVASLNQVRISFTLLGFGYFTDIRYEG